MAYKTTVVETASIKRAKYSVQIHLLIYRGYQVQYRAVIELITSTKGKNSRLHVFEISELTT